MAIIFQDEDAIEPVADTLGEAWGNASLYNVVYPKGGSCALTYDAADMTVDLAAGQVTHNGNLVAVPAAANGYTLVSDSSNPRWTWLAVSSAGAPVVVSGTAAADPSIPELGDYVMVALVYVQANLTIATNASYKLDKRITSPNGPYAQSTTATSTTSTSEVTLVTLSGLSIPVGAGIRIRWNMRKTAAAAQTVGFGLILNATTVLDTNDVSQWVSSGTQRAEDGFAEVIIYPRSSADYLNGFWTFGGWRVSATGAQATAAAIANATPTALIPNATITDIGIRAINNTTSNAAEVTYFAVWVF